MKTIRFQINQFTIPIIIISFASIIIESIPIISHVLEIGVGKGLFLIYFGIYSISIFQFIIVITLDFQATGRLPKKIDILVRFLQFLTVVILDAANLFIFGGFKENLKSFILFLLPILLETINFILRVIHIRKQAKRGIIDRID